MAIVNQIPADTFENLAKGAGMITTDFTPSAPSSLSAEKILCATSGGVKLSCVPTIVDHADGIDNAKTGMLEMQEVTSYEATMSFTCKTVSAETLKIAIGLTNTSGNKITPKHGMVTASNVKDLWLIIPQTDKKVFAAVLRNSFSTGGLDFQSENEGNGSLNITLKGMYKMAAQDTVPLECYVITDGAMSLQEDSGK